MYLDESYNGMEMYFDSKEISFFFCRVGLNISEVINGSVKKLIKDFFHKIEGLSM